MKFDQPVKILIKSEWWATPSEGITLDALIDHMNEIGNKVLQVDRENNRILINQTEDTARKVI